MRNFIVIKYFETGQVQVKGDRHEFPVMLNRPNRPNTFMENVRARLPGGLYFDITDCYFGKKDLFVDGNLNADLPGAIKAAFANPARYNRRNFE
jgi:hypothetical protein